MTFDPNHDDLALRASKKYGFEEKGHFKNCKKVGISDGIVNEESAKRYLGEKLDKAFVLLRSSISF